MTHIEVFTDQLEHEAATTRKMLSRVPTDKFDWKPHQKSMSIKQLAIHIAELPNWIGITFTTDELDFETNPYKQEDINTTEELMAYFETCLAGAREHFALAKEESLPEVWTLRSGATIYSKRPKWEIIRMTMSQIIHHRAQLGVYLRLLDVPLPGSYGPTADEAF